MISAKRSALILRMSRDTAAREWAGPNAGAHAMATHTTPTPRAPLYIAAAIIAATIAAVAIVEAVL